MAKEDFNANAFLADDQAGIDAALEQQKAASEAAASNDDSKGQKKGEGDKGKEPEIDDATDYKLEEFLKVNESDEEQNVLEKIKELGYKPGDDINQYLDKLNGNQRREIKIPEGVDADGLTEQNRTQIQRIDDLLDDEKTSIEDRIRQALQHQYKGKLSEVELEDYIDSVLTDPVKRIQYDDNITSSLRNTRTEIINNAKEALATYRQQQEANVRTRQEALYNSRNIFGKVLKQDVLADIETKITNGEFAKVLADPANEAKLALMFYHQDLIQEVFSKPDHLEGIEEGKRLFFLRASNSQVNDSGDKPGSRQAKGFDAQAFIADS